MYHWSLLVEWLLLGYHSIPKFPGRWDLPEHYVESCWVHFWPGSIFAYPWNDVEVAWIADKTQEALCPNIGTVLIFLEEKQVYIEKTKQHNIESVAVPNQKVGVNDGLRNVSERKSCLDPCKHSFYFSMILPRCFTLWYKHIQYLLWCIDSVCLLLLRSCEFFDFQGVHMDM